MIRLALIFITIIWADSIFGQALFDIPDSLRIIDSVLILNTDNYQYQFIEDSVSGPQKTSYRISHKGDWVDQALGNNGGELLPSTITWDNNSGLRLGYNGLDAYRWTWEDISFYRTNVAITHLGVSLGTSFNNSNTSMQDNTQTDAVFNRNFKGNLNTTLQYRSIRESGMYSDDESRHLQVAWQLNQWNKKKNFFYHLGWIRNALNRQNNGGIESLSLLEDDFYVIRENMPTSFNDAGTRDASNLFRLGWTYWLNGQNNQSGIYLENETQSEYRYFKFFVKNSDNLDTALYKTLPLEDSGIRNAFTLQTYSNDFSINWSSRLFKSIKAGYRYAYSSLEAQPDSDILHYGTAHGRILFDYKERFIFDIDGYVETFEEVGDFDLSGNLNIQWKEWGALTAFSSLGRQSPQWNREQLYVNGTKVYDQTLNAASYFYFGGAINLKRLGLTLKLRQLILDQYSYFDSEFQVQTRDEILSVTSLEAAWELKLKKFYIRNAFMFESFDTQVFLQPLWQTRHHFYYQGRIKKNGSIFRLGVEAWVRQLSQQAQFIPLTSTFIPTGQLSGDEFIYQVQPYIQADIQTFSIFFKGENLQSLWWDTHFQEITDRPMFDWMLRIGINWRLKN